MNIDLCILRCKNNKKSSLNIRLWTHRVYVHHVQHLLFQLTIPQVKCVPAKLAPQVCYSKSSHKNQQLTVLETHWAYTCSCVFVWADIVLFSAVVACNGSSGDECVWRVIALPKFSVSVKKLRHANCQWGEGGVAIKRWRHGHPVTYTDLQAYWQTHRHSSTAVPSLTSNPVSWLALINQSVWKRTHIGWWLLCSASAQWWHHGVWDSAAIFSNRQRVTPPASVQGQTKTLEVWWRVRLS